MALIYFILWLVFMAFYLMSALIVGAVALALSFFLLSMYTWGFALGLITGIIGFLIVHALLGVLILNGVAAIWRGYSTFFTEALTEINAMTLDKF